MFTLVHWVFSLSAYGALQGEDFRSCLYFSLLGFTLSLAFLHLFGPAALIVLTRAG